MNNGATLRVRDNPDSLAALFLQPLNITQHSMNDRVGFDGVLKQYVRISRDAGDLELECQ